MIEYIMKTSEVVERLKALEDIRGVKVVKERIVRRWASENGVSYTGEGNRKDYNFSEEDFERFLNRQRPGRPWEEDR